MELFQAMTDMLILFLGYLCTPGNFLSVLYALSVCVSAFALLRRLVGGVK